MCNVLTQDLSLSLSTSLPLFLPPSDSILVYLYIQWRNGQGSKTQFEVSYICDLISGYVITAMKLCQGESSLTPNV